MNISKTTASLVFLSFFQISSMIYADTAASKPACTSVTVSGQRVMMESETGKALQITLQGEQKKLAGPLQKAEQDFREKEQKLLKSKETLDHDVAEFDKASKAMSTEARNQKVESLQERAQKLEDDKRELDRLVQKLQADSRKIEAKMSEVYQKEMAKFEALVKETIKDLAQRHGWQIVLMEESIVYADPSLSKTKEVVAELDKKAKAANQAKKEALEKEMKK